MNDFHLINLANSTVSERRAEADRHRLARAAQASSGASADPEQQSPPRPRIALGSFIGRLALR